jgi:hypothetical protein
MMILSQNKMMCVPFEKGLTYVNCIDTSQIYWSDTADNNIEGIALGKYNSKEDSMVVLDKILHGYSDGHLIVFEMPQSDEI